MTMPDCPAPESLAGLAQAASDEKESLIAHLAGCDVCRRQVALLVVAEETTLPSARLLPPLRPARRPPPVPRWRRCARTAAAVIVLGAVAWLAFRGPLRRPPSPTPPPVEPPAGR